MFENIANFFKKLIKSETKETPSKDTAKERLHLVLMQDRANVSADFLELMKQEIIEVIKKYIEVEESAIDVRLTNEVGEDGKQGAPSLYANIPILNIKNTVKNEKTDEEEQNKENEITKSDDKKIKEETNTPNTSDKKEETEQKENNVKEESKEENIDKNEETVKEENNNDEDLKKDKKDEKENIDELKKEEEKNEQNSKNTKIKK